MGRFFGTWATGSDYGGSGQPRTNYRDEIPDWFYDFCFKVVEIRGYPCEHEISLYCAEKQLELRERRQYQIGTVLFYCSETGNPKDFSGPPFPGGPQPTVERLVAIEKETWERWQEILTSSGKPRQGQRMMANMAPNDNWQGITYAREWWLRSSQPYEKPDIYKMPNLREDVQTSNDRLMNLLFEGE
jgi:hypothetical protein